MADLTRDALADKVDDIAIVLCDEYAKTLHKASAVLRQGAREAYEAVCPECDANLRVTRDNCVSHGKTREER